jgi:hypothetical protein
MASLVPPAQVIPQILCWIYSLHESVWKQLRLTLFEYLLFIMQPVVFETFNALFTLLNTKCTLVQIWCRRKRGVEKQEPPHRHHPERKSTTIVMYTDTPECHQTLQFVISDISLIMFTFHLYLSSMGVYSNRVWP